MKLMKSYVIAGLALTLVGNALATTVTKTMTAAVNTNLGLRGASTWQPFPSTNSLLQCVDSNDGATSYAFNKPDEAGSFAASGHSHYLDMTGFFTSSDIPSGATIDGVEVDMTRDRALVANPSGALKGFKDQHVLLLNVSGAADKADTVNDWPTSFAVKTYGGSADLWGTSISQAQLVSSSFGVRLQVQSGQNSDNGDQMYQGQVTYVTVSVTYH